jgi:hypothetical protein
MVEEEAEEKVEHRLRLNIQGIRTRRHLLDGFSWSDDGGKERMVVLSIFVFVQVLLAVTKR